MTLDDFMLLEKNDGVIYDGRVVTVTAVRNYYKGRTYCLHGMRFQAIRSMRELELTYYDKFNRFQQRYAVIYTNAPKDEVHNKTVLSRMQIWDPFQDQGVLL